MVDVSESSQSDYSILHINIKSDNKYLERYEGEFSKM